MSVAAIRRMTEDDVPAVARIERECFSKPWSENALLAELERFRCDFFVFELDGEVVGYIGSYITVDESEIANVAVLRAHRGKGFGGKLLDHAVENAKAAGCVKMSLEVRTGNLSAIGLYESRGFRIMTVRKGFYSEPEEDAYLMVREF